MGLEAVRIRQRLVAFAERRLDLPAVGDVEHGEEGVAVGEWHGGELEIPAVGERDAPAPLLAFDRGAAHQLPDDPGVVRILELLGDMPGHRIDAGRSEERRVGQGCVSTWRSGWARRY